jgi:hypothetical protein
LITRSTAGREAHKAWKVDPITEDVEMNMPDLFGRLNSSNDGIEQFREHIVWASKTRRGEGARMAQTAPKWSQFLTSPMPVVGWFNEDEKLSPRSRLMSSGWASSRKPGPWISTAMQSSTSRT